MSDTPTTTRVQDSDLDLLEELDDLGAPPPVPPALDDPRKKRRRKILAWILVAVLIVFGALAAWYLVNRKPLSELPGLESGKVPTYKTSFYGVEKPLGVAVSLDGSRLYATQSGTTAAAFVLDRDGRKIGELKPPPGKPGTYHVPVYLAVDPTSGDVYVGDRAAGAVYIYDSAGTYRSTFTPKGKVGKFSPLGLAVDKDGTLYVADVADVAPSGHRILVFSKDGTLVKTLGKGKLNYPNAIVPGAQGEIYVADSNNGRVIVFERSGTLTTLLARGIGDGDLGLPRGMAVDDKGRLFVVDTTDQMVRVFTTAKTPTGPPAYVGAFGDQGRENGTFLFPNGLATDTRGRIYVADRENNRIQVWGY
jgi:DNA-binding beta-propeller fold protein YncE